MGQIEAIERAVQEDRECARVLQQATACRRALDGFICEVIEDHIREHMVCPQAPSDDPRTQAAEELIEIVHAYIKHGVRAPSLCGATGRATWGRSGW